MELNGQRLSLAEVSAVAQATEPVALAEVARARIEASRRVIEQIIAENRTVYGVNTGFGKLSDVRIAPSQIRELQLNLVRSHSCGLGDPLSIEEARAMVLLRANVLALGYSGCRPIVVETLVEMLRRGVTPVIPEKGSVGASGDLAPLAHLALTAIGEGESFFADQRVPSAEALARAEERRRLLRAGKVDLTSWRCLARINRHRSCVCQIRRYVGLRQKRRSARFRSESLNAPRQFCNGWVV